MRNKGACRTVISVTETESQLSARHAKGEYIDK